MPYQIHAIDRGPDDHRYARFAETPTGWPLAQCARADPPATVRPPPCAVCGGTERWDHEGILRCVTCWPLEGSRTHARADVAASAPGTTRGDPPCMTDDDAATDAQRGSWRCCPCRCHACCAAASRQRLPPASCQPRQHGGVGSQARSGWLGYRLCGACMALPAQERTLQVEGALAAPLVGRNHEAMDTRSRGMLPCPACGLVARPQIVRGTDPHALKASWTGCGRFLQWLSKPKEVAMPRNMQRKGQPLGRAGMVITSYLSHPRASDVSDAGRSGIMPVQRREA